MEQEIPVVEKIPFDITQILKYGNELEISGMYLANGKEGELILFPEASEVQFSVMQPTHEQWKELLHQLDTLGVKGLNKIVLRKSQRNIEQTISWNVFRRDNYTCQYCGKNDVPLTVDHIILWENMGASIEANLISACKKCNKTRGNMEFPEWLKSKYLLDVLNQGWNIRWDQQREELEKMYGGALKVPLRNTQRSR